MKGLLHHGLAGRVTGVTANLITKSAGCEPARLDRMPAELAHQFGQATAGARGT